MSQPAQSNESEWDSGFTLKDLQRESADQYEEAEASWVNNQEGTIYDNCDQEQDQVNPLTLGGNLLPDDTHHLPDPCNTGKSPQKILTW